MGIIRIVSPESGGHSLAGLSEGAQRKDSQAPGPVAALPHLLSPLLCGPCLEAVCQTSMVFPTGVPTPPSGIHHPEKLTQSLYSDHGSLTQKTLFPQFPYGFLLFALLDPVQVLYFAGMVFLADTIPPKHTHPLISPAPLSSCRTLYYLCLNLSTQL